MAEVGGACDRVRSLFIILQLHVTMYTGQLVVHNIHYQHL